MTTLAKVELWGRTIGAVALDSADGVARFEYEPAFVESGIENRRVSAAFPHWDVYSADAYTAF